MIQRKHCTSVETVTAVKLLPIDEKASLFYNSRSGPALIPLPSRVPLPSHGKQEQLRTSNETGAAAFPKLLQLMKWLCCSGREIVSLADCLSPASFFSTFLSFLCGFLFLKEIAISCFWETSLLNQLQSAGASDGTALAKSALRWKRRQEPQ